MKKKFVLFICTLAALLAACQPSQQSGSTGAATESTGLPETTVQTETTVPTTTAPPETTVPTTAPEETTEPTEDLLAAYEAWQEYISAGDAHMGWAYTGEPHHNPLFDCVDTSTMETGCFYQVFFDEDDCYIGHYLIADELIQVYTTTSEHIYFVLPSDPTRIYRSDLNGENRVLMFETEYGKVSGLRYYGVDATGKLILCENREEQDRITSYDILTGETKVLMEAYMIGQFYYSPSSLARDLMVETIGDKEMGALICWKGKLHENDPDRPPSCTFYYIIETGEQLDLSSYGNE